MIVRRRAWCAALVCASPLVLLAAARLEAQPAPAVRAAPAGAPSARAAVATLQAWVDAFNSRDPERIVALYAPTAVFWGTTAAAIATTPDQVWAYFKDSRQRPATRVSIDSTHARVFGDVAVVSGGYTFADVTDGAAGNVRPARYSMVFRKIDGRWLIVDHHSSRMPVP